MVCHLGRVEYREAAALQERLRERVIAGELPDLMLLLEHPPVYTIGRRSDEGDLPFGEAFYRERGHRRRAHAARRPAHLPRPRPAGRLPDHARRRACRSTSSRWSARSSTALGDAGVEADTKLGHKHVGVWVGERKIASVGVHISHGVSSHGFAVNVTNDLDPFTGSWPAGCPRCR